MGDQDILVPNKVEIKIHDRIYEVGTLTLNQIIKLGKLLGQVLMSSQEKLKQLAEQSKESKSNAQDLINILDLLNEKDTAKFFSIVLNEKDIEFLEKELLLDTTFEIVAVLCEHNKFNRVKKNFQRINNALKQSEKTN